MLSVGQFAQQAQVSTRTLRYYESIGLMPKASRGDNNYRYYHQELLNRVSRIRDLQSLGFSLDQIKEFIHLSNEELKQGFQNKLLQLSDDIDKIQDQKMRLENLLSISTKIELGEFITDMERDLYMQTIKDDLMLSLKNKYKSVTESEIKYLNRETWIYENPQAKQFIDAAKKCMAFANEHNLKLGPGRGSGPASIVLFAMGFIKIDPLKYDLIPERVLASGPYLHIDVEFENGQIFVDYCRELNKQLTYGEIQAFKMPLLDIMKNVDQTLGYSVDYDSIDENSEIILRHFQSSADMDKIFNFDYSPNALVMKYENFLPEYEGLHKINEYITSQKIYNFRDIINITSLWRPNSQEIIDRLQNYKNAKLKIINYTCLDQSLQKYLLPNFGIIIYHEDITQIISFYTGWDLKRCNRIRTDCLKQKQNENPDWLEFKKIVSLEISNLIQEESRWSFCMPHAIAFAEFTKYTAILKSLHKDVYYSEIEKFEKKHGYTWDDIGIKIKGVSLLQD